MTLGLSLGLGLVAGVLAGLLGIGGGMIIIPGLVLLLGQEQHMAQGISLGVIIFTGTAGALVHYRQGTVLLKVAMWTIPSAVAFSVLGSLLAARLEAELLVRLFGLFLVSVGVRMFLMKKRGAKIDAS